MHDRRIIYSLKNETPQRHIGEYFQVLKRNGKNHLYYCSLNKIKLVISDTLDFVDKESTVIIEQAPGGCFCIIENDNKLFMLCGTHGSDKKEDEYEVPDLVWPKEKRFLIDWTMKREDRKNGMYLLSSDDGINWQEVGDYPVMHAYVSSDSCLLGEMAFDTSPCLIKYNEQFFYYGRLNSSLDERKIYVRKSDDLINWTLPEKINVIDENNNLFKKNYYNAAVFVYNNELYMFTPYFEACGTEERTGQNGCTLLMKSSDGVSWKSIKSFLPHDGKYKHRVNDVIIRKDDMLVLYRENIWLDNQDLVSYSLSLEELE